MTIVFERIQTEGIAQISYLIGDTSTQTAAVVDPIPNSEEYLQLASQHSVSITHIFETHIHADFMSGSRELQHQCGRAKIYASGEGDAEYEFTVDKTRSGDKFSFGAVTLTARHTPGHTPEHLSFELSETHQTDKPWGVLSGDSLFVGSAGRPDLLGDSQTDELTRQLFTTLREYYLSLDDGVIIYPCHGAGSACGADIGERPMSTIGYERKTNHFLQIEDFEQFKKFVNDGAPPVPHHYPILKKINTRKRELVLGHPIIPGLTAEEFQADVKNGESQPVDTRPMLAFGGGHVQGTMNIGDRPELSVWAGDMLSQDRPISLILKDESELHQIGWHFAHVGLTKFSGYLVGGMEAWQNKGLPLVNLPQLSVHDLADNREDFQLLDVRSPAEFEKGHIPNAHHYYVAEMRDGFPDAHDLDPERPTAVYCESGYRASIAASILQREGFKKVFSVPGSMMAWRAAGYEVTK